MMLLKKAKVLIFILFSAWATANFAGFVVEILPRNIQIQSPEALDGKKMLIIIDMQQGFTAARDCDLQKSVRDQIKKAKREKMIIIFIELAYAGPTIPALMEIIENYPYAFRLTKKENSGCEVVKKFMEIHGIRDIPEIRVCGVNTDLCVLSTVVDLCLNNVMGTLTVLAQSCAAQTLERHNLALSELENCIVNDYFFNVRIDRWNVGDRLLE